MNEQLTLFGTKETVKTVTSQKSRFEDYEGFVEKFKPKKTTDDCYTPETVYNAIADWVAEEYYMNRADFVRPFFPGGDYEHFDYSGGKIVVDNPPFSILAKIIDFYIAQDVKFFLFAPQLTSLKHVNKGCCFVCSNSVITYENGAKVKTSFLTNLETDNAIRVIPKLSKLIDKADKENIKQSKPPELPKYKYPPEVVSIALISTFARHNIPIKIKHNEIKLIEKSRLDSQAESKKDIFGGGFFVSKSKGQELEEARRQAEEARRQAEEARRQAEEARRVVWTLSPRELEIIKELEEITL